MVTSGPASAGSAAHNDSSERSPDRAHSGELCASDRGDPSYGCGSERDGLTVREDDLEAEGVAHPDLDHLMDREWLSIGVEHV